jgi:WD40 repeat protein/actin-like ATPase involved in cell morphogenesis
MKPCIAIDFGTSRTKVAYLPAANRAPELMRFTDDEAERSYLPSLFYVPKEDSPPLFGFAAEAMLEEDPAGVIDSLKRRLREAKLRVNGREVSGQALLTALFRHIREQAIMQIASLRQADELEAVLTVPAMFGPAQRDLLRNAALEAGFTAVGEPVDEPVAAARAWLADGATATAHLLVMDCGGGTVDWAYLRRDDGGQFRVVPEVPPGGIERLGGHDVDEGLVELVERKLAEAGVETPEFGIVRRARIRARMRRLKELLRRTEAGARPLRIGDRVVELSREEIEATVAERFVAQAMDGLIEYRRRVVARLSEGDAVPVLLVGGSARLPGMMDALKARGCEVIAWDRADYAAVVGALCLDRGMDETERPAGSSLVLMPNRPIATGRRTIAAIQPEATLPLERDRDNTIEILLREAGVAFRAKEFDRALLLTVAAWGRSFHFDSDARIPVLKAMKALAMLPGKIGQENLSTDAIIKFLQNDVIVIRDNFVLKKIEFSRQGGFKNEVIFSKYRSAYEFFSDGSRIFYVESKPYNQICLKKIGDGDFLGGIDREKLSINFSSLISFCRNRALFSYWYPDGAVYQFDLISLKFLDIPHLVVQRPVHAIYCPSGEYILSISPEGHAAEWNAADGSPSGRVYATSAKCLQLSYHLNGTRVVTLDDSETITFWSRKDGKKSGEPIRHQGLRPTINISKNQDRIATTGDDKIVRIWSAIDGAPTGVAIEHTTAVNIVVFSPDGSLLATAMDESIMIYDAHSGSPIGEPLPLAKSKSLSFSSDSSTLLVHLPDAVLLWDVGSAYFDGDELVYHLCHDRAQPLRKLTKEELSASLIADLDADPAEVCRKLFQSKPQFSDLVASAIRDSLGSASI